MRKIPTVFVRDLDDRKHVTSEVTPGCEWVLAGEGVATRKYDGTCCMFDGDLWWARREVKPGKSAPPDFVPITTDDVTGKTVGWELMEASGFAKWHTDALSHFPYAIWSDGTYELCGPKINGDPECFGVHTLRFHGTAERLRVGVAGEPLTFERIRDEVVRLGVTTGCEGIVWHHPDGRMAKLKARDFTAEATS